MKKYKWAIILANLILLLGLFNVDIYKKEALLEEGQLILLELAPVDPRSLMQGDYMTLRYAIARNNAVSVSVDSIESTLKRGYCIVKLDEFGVAERLRLQNSTMPISENEYAIRFNSVGWQGIDIGAASYFFQEGEAEKYEDAKYGGLKVDKSGNSILVGLYDEDRELIDFY